MRNTNCFGCRRFKVNDVGKWYSLVEPKLYVSMNGPNTVHVWVAFKLSVFVRKWCIRSRVRHQNEKPDTFWSSFPTAIRRLVGRRRQIMNEKKKQFSFLVCLSSFFSFSNKKLVHYIMVKRKKKRKFKIIKKKKKCSSFRNIIQFIIRFLTCFT